VVDAPGIWVVASPAAELTRAAHATAGHSRMGVVGRRPAPAGWAAASAAAPLSPARGPGPSGQPAPRRAGSRGARASGQPAPRKKGTPICRDLA